MFGRIETRLNFYTWVALMCAAFLFGNYLPNNTFGVVGVPILVFLMVVSVAGSFGLALPLFVHFSHRPDPHYVSARTQNTDLI